MPPLRDPEYRWRLKRLRDRQFSFLNSLATIIKGFAFVVFLYGATMLCYFLTLIVIASMGLSGGSSNNLSDMSSSETAILILLALVMVIGLPVFCVALLAPGIRRYVDNMHETRYGLAASYLHHTDFLRVVAEEDFTQIIIEQVAEIPSLRWFSPHQPKTIEQQLEFSACYWNSIVQLSYGPGRLDNASLINGSWTYQLSRVSPYMCCTCCLLPYIGQVLLVFILPLFFMTCNYHLNKVARICCVIDYLCEDRFA